MLVVASVALTLGLVELGSWFWVTRVRPQHLTQWEFRATQPPPYQGADYFSPEFLAEAEKSVSGTLSTIAELRDFKGRYFNVVNGFRVTTDAPADPVRRVVILSYPPDQLSDQIRYGNSAKDFHIFTYKIQH